MGFELRDESKSRKLKPHAERNPNFSEYTDLNLYYAHEIVSGNYSYDDALKVYLNRASNNISYLTSKKVQAEYFEFKDKLAAGEDYTNTALYIKTKALLDRILADPDIEKNIPKEYWDAFSNFYGVNPAQLHHPHFYLGFEVELEQLEKCKLAESLVVLHCAARKPYSDNKGYKQYIGASREFRDFDVCILSLYPTMITPLDTSVRYPHICYDWPHIESPGMLYHYEAHNLRMLAYLIKRLKYKNVIFIEWGQMKHLHLLRDYYGIDYISLRELDMYSRWHRYLFSTKEIDENNELVKEWKGCQRQRVLCGSSASYQLMVDLFGQKMRKYFGCSPQYGIKNLSEEGLKWIGYPEYCIEPIKKEKIEEW
jgi:hypothetical protein